MKQLDFTRPGKRLHSYRKIHHFLIGKPSINGLFPIIIMDIMEHGYNGYTHHYTMDISIIIE